MSKQASSWAQQVEEIYQQLDPSIYGRVGVLLGGKSGERVISLQSGHGVLKALQSFGIDVQGFDPGIQHISDLSKQKFDRVFIALHGRFGEDGTMQGLLEQLDIPYTGSGVLASALAIDKKVTKNLWLSQGLSTPKFVMLHQQTNWKQVVDELGLPIIVKPSREGSSLGLTKVKQATELQAAYDIGAPVTRLAGRR